MEFLVIELYTNSEVLFVSCHSPQMIPGLKSKQKTIRFRCAEKMALTSGNNFATVSVTDAAYYLLHYAACRLLGGWDGQQKYRVAHLSGTLTLLKN